MVPVSDPIFAEVDLVGADAVGACPISADALPYRSRAAAGATNTYSNPVEVNCPAPPVACEGRESRFISRLRRPLL